MNIRAIAGQLFTSPIQKKDQTKTETHPDRDAHPEYQQGSGGNTPDRHMNELELAQVVENLKSMKGVTDHGLTVRLVMEGGIARVFIESPDGKVVRRVSEKDLWSVLKNKEKSTGNLLDKAT